MRIELHHLLTCSEGTVRLHAFPKLQDAPNEPLFGRKNSGAALKTMQKCSGGAWGVCTACLLGIFSKITDGLLWPQLGSINQVP